jgi:hypothetical protein
MDLTQADLQPCIPCWLSWELRDQAAAAWCSQPEAVQAAADATAHCTAFDAPIALAGSHAAARRWRWADGVSPAQPAAAHTALADAYRLWRAEACNGDHQADAGKRRPAADGLARFVRRARRRGALPGWWALNGAEDVAACGADATPARPGELEARHDAERLASLRALAADVARGGGDDSDAEDALSEDGSVADAGEAVPPEIAARCTGVRDAAARRAARAAAFAALSRAQPGRYGDAEALRLEGNAAFAAGAFGAAVLAYTAALEAPQTAEASPAARAVLHCNRSAAFARLFRWRRALADADACIALAPASFKGKLRRAAALCAQGRHAAATAELCARRGSVSGALGAPRQSVYHIVRDSVMEIQELRRRVAAVLACCVRPRAEHCASVLRFLLPHVGTVLPDVVAVSLRFAHSCVLGGGGAEFDAAGGILATRVLCTTPPGLPAAPWALEAHALTAAVRGAMQAARLPPRHFHADAALAQTLETTSIMAVMPAAMAALFGDVAPVLSACRAPATMKEALSILQAQCEADMPPRADIAAAGGADALAYALLNCCCCATRSARAMRALATLLEEPSGRACAAAIEARCDEALLNCLCALSLDGLRTEPHWACDALSAMYRHERAHACAASSVQRAAALACMAMEDDGSGGDSAVAPALSLAAACTAAGGARVRCLLLSFPAPLRAARAALLTSAGASPHDAARRRVHAVALCCNLAARSPGGGAALAAARLPESLLTAADAACRAAPLAGDPINARVAGQMAMSEALVAQLAAMGTTASAAPWLPDATRLAARWWRDARAAGCVFGTVAAAGLLNAACVADADAAAALLACGLTPQALRAAGAPFASAVTHPPLLALHALCAAVAAACDVAPVGAAAAAAISRFGTAGARLRASDKLLPLARHAARDKRVAAHAKAVLAAFDDVHAPDEELERALAQRLGVAPSPAAPAAPAAAPAAAPVAAPEAPPPPQQEQVQCAACGATPAAKKLPRCARCRRAAYCDAACAAAHWRAHKRECTPAADE